MKDFDLKRFKEEISDSELLGLEYLEKTIIKELKAKYDLINYNKDEYLVSLFYAVRELQNCMFMYEQTNIKNVFNTDLYFETRDLLLAELSDYYNIDFTL